MHLLKANSLLNGKLFWLLLFILKYIFFKILYPVIMEIFTHLDIEHFFQSTFYIICICLNLDLFC